ncbi:MAG: hypothetical protein WCN95_08610 [bacterium]
MGSPMWCPLCKRNVVPEKKFNWLVAIFLCGICYVPIWLLQKPKCPICTGQGFQSPHAE